MKTLRDFFVSPTKGKPGKLPVSTSDEKVESVVHAPDNGENGGAAMSHAVRCCNGHGNKELTSPTPKVNGVQGQTKAGESVSIVEATEPELDERFQTLPPAKIKHHLGLRKKTVKDSQKPGNSTVLIESSSSRATIPEVVTVSYDDFLKLTGDGKADPALETNEIIGGEAHEISYEDFLQGGDFQENNKQEIESHDINTMPDADPTSSAGAAGNTAEVQQKPKLRSTRTRKDVGTKSVRLPTSESASSHPHNEENGEIEAGTEAKPAKAMGSIMQYFSRVSLPKDRFLGDATRVKTSAVVHPSPSKCQNMVSKHHRKASDGFIPNSNVVALNEEKDMFSITQLDSSIIEVPVKRKRRDRKKEVESATAQASKPDSYPNDKDKETCSQSSASKLNSHPNDKETCSQSLTSKPNSHPNDKETCSQSLTSKPDSHPNDKETCSQSSASKLNSHPNDKETCSQSLTSKPNSRPNDKETCSQSLTSKPDSHPNDKETCSQSSASKPESHLNDQETCSQSWASNEEPHEIEERKVKHEAKVPASATTPKTLISRTTCLEENNEGRETAFSPADRTLSNTAAAAVLNTTCSKNKSPEECSGESCNTPTFEKLTADSSKNKQSDTKVEYVCLTGASLKVDAPEVPQESTSEDDVLLLESSLEVSATPGLVTSGKLQASLNVDISKSLKKTQQSVLQFRAKGGLGLGLASGGTAAEPRREQHLEIRAKAASTQPGRIQPCKSAIKEVPTISSTLQQARRARPEKRRRPAAELIGKKRKEKSENASVTDCIVEDEAANLSDSFSVSMVKKTKPLVMRFTRLRARINSPEGQVKQVKLCRAQKLLQKARVSNKRKASADKTNKTLCKEQPDNRKKSRATEVASSSSDCVSPPTRRSSRNSARMASLAISMCYEGNSTGVSGTLGQTPKRQGEKKKTHESPPARTLKKREGKKRCDSPAKSPCPATPASSKTGKKNLRSPCPTGSLKLAPIFMKGSKKTSDPSGSPKRTPRHLTAEELEVQRIRRQFLTSGLPAVVQRQQMVDATAAVADYPPVPAVNHVMQKSPREGACMGLDVWNLPNISLKLRPLDEGGSFWDTQPSLVPGVLTDSQINVSAFNAKEQSEVSLPLASEVVDLLLAEILTKNPSYPVRRTYKQLSKHRSEALHPGITESQSGEVTGITRESLELAAQETGSLKKRKSSGSTRGGKVEGPKRLRRSRRSAGLETKTLSTAEKCETNVEQTSPDHPASGGLDCDAGNKNKNEVLWTDKYQPVQATEVLGNAGVVKKLKGWLMDWKERLDAEMKRQRKLQLRQAKREGKSLEEVRKKFGQDWWGDDDSDFALSDDDSDHCDEDRLCHTVLLTGPTGCGKTVTVYALAKELGYKVFEVNASSKRSGRQILAQLQEATQSHQVSNKKADGALGNYGLLSKNDARPVASRSEKKPLPSAFTNLFNKKSAMKSTKIEKNMKTDSRDNQAKKNSKLGKKRKSSDDVVVLKEEHSPVQQPTKKCKKGPVLLADDPSTITAGQKGLDLSSVSLILFEDVDVVFEEDKGFWAAVDTFMQSTKVPIMLTTTDTNFLERVSFARRIDQYSMKLVPLTNLATHLQLICLAEMHRTSYSDVLLVAEACRGDIRQSLLTLQYLFESGGTRLSKQQPVVYSERFLKSGGVVGSGSGPKVPSSFAESETKSILPTFGTAGDANSEDEFSPHTARQRPKRRSKPLASEESSVDSISMTPQNIQPPEAATESQPEGTPSANQQFIGTQAEEMVTGSDLVTVENSQSLPLPCVWQGLFENASGVVTLLRNCGCSPPLKLALDLEKCLASTLAYILQHYHDLGHDLLCENVSWLLPLPCTTRSPPPREPLRSAKSCWSRIQCRNDFWQDSDEDVKADSDFPNLPKKLSASKEASEEQVRSPPKSATPGDKLVQDALDSMSELYNDLSLLDTMHSGTNWWQDAGELSQVEQAWRTGRLCAGQTDSLGTGPGQSHGGSLHQEGVANVACTAQALSLGLHTRRLRETVASIQGLGTPSDRLQAVEALTVYHGGEAERLCLQNPAEQRLAVQRQRAASDLCHHLPCYVQCHRRAVVLDYVPGIRAICQLEECRKAYGNKRRFLHHLDSLVSRLKTSTVDSLCSSFK